VEASTAARRRPGRRSVEDRVGAVLEILSGKASVDQVATRFGVRSQTVEGWRQDALESVGNAMRQGSGKTPREIELEKKLRQVEKAFTEVAIRKELLENALKVRPFLPGRFTR
jgi:transposase-like protein